MSRITLIIIGIVLFTTACSRNERENFNFDMNIDSQAISKFTIGEIVDSIFYLPLETNVDAMMRDIDKIRMIGDRIYLGDFQSNKISVYSQQGSYLYTINRMGQGPGEYTTIKSFAVNEKYIYAIDNWTRKLLLYNNNDGTFVKSIPMPFVAWDVETLHDGNLIFAYTPLPGVKLSQSQPPYRLFITNQNLTILHTMLKYRTDETDPIGQKQYFTNNGEQIIFGSYLFDGYTIIDRRNPQDIHHVHIDFQNGLSNQRNVDLNSIQQFQYITEPPFVCNSHIHLSINQSEQLENVIYSKSTQQLYFNSKTVANNYLLPVIGSEKGFFISALTDYDLYKEMTALGFIQGSKQVETALKNEGTVLIFYRFRHEEP